MKRSRTATLLLMASSPVLLVACSDDAPPVQQEQFTTLEQCTAAGNLLDDCKKAEEHAKQVADTSAPRYMTRDECIKDFPPDQCVQRQDQRQGSIWGPLMTGFMISHLMSNGMRGSFYQSEPLYRRSTGSFYQPSTGAGTGAYAGSSFAARGLGTGSLTAPEGAGGRGATASRGGFGARGSAGE